MKVSSIRTAESLFQYPDRRHMHVRYDGMQASLTIGKNVCPIRDWNMRGVSFETNPETMQPLGERVTMTMEFRFPHGSVVVCQEGRIVRSAWRGISAAQFLFPQKDQRRKFEKIIDALNTQIFFESQAA